MITKEPFWDRIVTWAPDEAVNASDMMELMGLPRFGWRTVPYLRKSVTNPATVRCARERFGGLNERALTLALEYLGLAQDSPDRNNSPGAVFLARLRTYRRHTFLLDRESPDWATFLVEAEKEVG